MTENNYVPDLPGQNAAYPTAPTYPATSAYPTASTYSATPTYSSTPAYPVANAQYAQNPYASQMHAQAPKRTNGLAIGGFATALLAVLSFVLIFVIAAADPFVDEDIIGVFFILSCVFTVIGLVLSIVGTSMSKRFNSGLGLGVTGIVFSAIMLLILIIFIIFAVSLARYYFYW